jgi:hypothetical protein
VRWPSRRGVTVDQGQVIITDVDLISRSRHHRVWYIECHSKYPVLLGTSEVEVLLYADERTIKCDRDALATRITFPVPRGWTLLCEGSGRYSLMVMAFRQNVGHKRLWHDYETAKEPRYQHPPEGT